MDSSGAFRSEENGRVQSLDTLSCEDPAWHEPVSHIFFLDGHGNVALNQVRSSVAKRSRKRRSATADEFLFSGLERSLLIQEFAQFYDPLPPRGGNRHNRCRQIPPLPSWDLFDSFG
jgi:hypothetical protein